jgi:prolyl-tRNA editing enzyme YbaK/EbsC (Cys-tRNA(Pro) deacylase)
MSNLDNLVSLSELPELSELHASVKECLERCGITYKVFSCDPALADTHAFCEHYGFTPGQAANAIIAAGKSTPTKFACCIVLATTKLDVNKKVCPLLQVKKASFATGEQTMELTGMQIGGVTPFGLPDIPIYVDAAVMNENEVVLGGGNRSTKVLLHPDQLRKLPGLEIIEGLAIPKV